MKHKSKKVNITEMKYLNEQTGKFVGYVRALQLNIIKSAKHGFFNPKTGKVVALYRAKQLGLV